MHELRLVDVSKKYGKKTALQPLSFSFYEGIYGLLGPNGAGKSTLMNMITMNLKPTTGSICFDGQDIQERHSDFLNYLGFVPQQQQMSLSFTGEEFLLYMASLKGIPRKEAIQIIDQYIHQMHLEEHRHRKISEYSGGMKQRVLLIQALLNDPRILILDEPTAGVDPKERVVIRNTIKDIAKNKIIIFATHIASDLEKVADHYLFLKEGVLLDTASEEAAILNGQANLEDVYMNLFGMDE